MGNNTSVIEKQAERSTQYEFWKIAIKRFFHHKLAVVSAVIIAVYFFVGIFSPLMPFYSYKKSVPIHQKLPPSFIKTAGELLYVKTEKELFALANKEDRSVLNEKELQMLRDLKIQIATETYVDKKGSREKNP